MLARSMYSENLTEALPNCQVDSDRTVVDPESKSGCRWIKWLIFLFLLAAAALFYEMRTSALQSRLLPWYAAKLSYQEGAGPSDQIVFPKGGPFDERRGYTRI